VGYVRARASRRASPEAKGRPKAAMPCHRTYSVPFRLRAVKLHLEEGLPTDQVCRETGISSATLRAWLERYQAGGEPALKPKSTSPKGRRQIAPAVKAEIVVQKRLNPTFGVKRISQFLQRMLHLPGSPETVRQTLRQEGLLASAPRRAAPVPPKPRFFERATPNQMWQSDIYTFHLAGKNAYLIGFMDDYSRFLVGLELYRSQTAENVLELYRRAVGEFGVPREMLTDNGRQYASWRGLTRFQQEMQKDKVHHIRSRPHHPMTLGKIERFWKSIWEEFLARAQFDSFEAARERVRFWVQYYNHRRPHQGIGGVCPADRFFEIRSDLRKVMEQGIAENVKELALRGKAQRPFYLVGRLDKQSVVMRAEKGRLVMTVNDDESRRTEEVVCDLNDGKVEHDGNAQEGQAADTAVLGGGQMPGGADAVDGTAVADGTVPGSGGVVERLEPVAGSGDGGALAGAGAEAQGARRADPARHAAAGAAGAQPGPDGTVGGDGTENPAGEDRGTGAAAVGTGGGAGEARDSGIDATLVAKVLRMVADGTLDRYVGLKPAGRAAGAPGAGSTHSATE
jgi:transposase InsO family protein